MALRESWDIMLDGLRHVQGADGGRQEASAWTLLACATADESTARQACLKAAHFGAPWDAIALAALEADSHLALSACFKAGHLTPSSTVEGAVRSVVAEAIASQAVKCLGWMAKSAFEPLGTDELMVYGKDKSWLFLAAASWKAESVEALLQARPWSQDELGEALDALTQAARYSTRSYGATRRNRGFGGEPAGPEDAARSLLRAGARWDGPAGPDLLGRDVPRLGSVAETLADFMFEGGSDRTVGQSMSIQALWKELAKDPHWSLMGGPGRRLGAKVMEMAFFSDPALARQAFDAAAREEVEELWEALARGAAKRGRLGPVMEEAKGWALAGAVDMPGPAVAAILLDACMPKQASHAPSGSRATEAAALAAWAYRMGGSGMAQAAARCERLLRERAEEERGAWLDPTRWAQWEEAILAVAAATPTPPRRSGFQARL
jgi:hypothetical protein